MRDYVAVIDAGTGGVRCALFDREGRAAGRCYRELETAYTPDGRAEQDPDRLVEAAFGAVAGALKAGEVDPDAVASVSVTGVQTSFVPLDGNGRALGRLILWQDARGLEMFPWIRQQLARAGLTEADLYRRTLKPLDALLAGAKLLWLRERDPAQFGKIRSLANPQAVLLRALGAEQTTIDPTDVGWFLAHDGATLEPDGALLRLFGLDPAIFPALKRCGEVVGRVSPGAAARTGLRAGTPLFQGAVDQCCAALGAGNPGRGDVGTLCLGTAGVLMTWREGPAPDPKGRYYVIPFPTGGFAAEAAVPVAAAAFRWVRDALFPAGGFDPENVYARMDAAAARAPAGAGGVLFLPHLAGQIFPETNAGARGGFVGASLGTTRGELMRAALEGVCFGMRQVIEAAGGGFATLRLLGGAARSALWCQMQADVYCCPVETMTEPEATALGAAMIAAAGAGLYPSLPDAVRGMSRVARRYEPDATRTRIYDEYYRAWTQCGEALTETFTALAAVRKT